MLAQAEDLSEGSDDELFLAQWIKGPSNRPKNMVPYDYVPPNYSPKQTDAPLDEASCDAAKSNTRRWWEVWYDWEDGVCKCWGWDGKQ